MYISVKVCVHCVRRTNLFEVVPNVLRQFIPNSLQLSQSNVNGHNYAQGEAETMQNQAEGRGGDTRRETKKKKKKQKMYSQQSDQIKKIQYTIVMPKLEI